MTNTKTDWHVIIELKNGAFTHTLLSDIGHWEFTELSSEVHRVIITQKPEARFGTARVVSKFDAKEVEYA